MGKNERHYCMSGERASFCYKVPELYKFVFSIKAE
jgi:hypothetical protein